MNGCMSLIESALNLASAALLLAICAATFAGLLAVVVLAMNVLFRRWLSSRQMGLLWGIVLLRLLIPFAPSSSFSLQNLLPPTPVAITDSVEIGPGVYMDLAQTASDAEQLPAEIESDESESSSDSIARSVARMPTAREIAVEILEFSFVEGLPSLLLVVVWLIGATSFLVTIIAYWRFVRRLKQVPVCADQRLCDLWEACCLLAGVRKSIPIFLFDGVHQPAVLGVFRPKLLLPIDISELDDQQLRMVMLHELAHVRHGDIAANWLLVVIRAVHWWNPVYWLAATRYQSLREQACDAFALRRIEGQPTRGYSELLLMLAARRPAGSPWRVMLPASILGFLSSFFRKRAIGNRLKALRFAGVIRGRWHTAGVAVLFSLIAVCGLTDAGTPQSPPDRPQEWLPAAGRNWAWSAILERDAGLISKQTYDVEKALQRIAGDERSMDDALVVMRRNLIKLLQGSTGQLDELTAETAAKSLTLEDHTLKVIATPRVHTEIFRTLSAWEHFGLCQITIAAPQFITADRDLAGAADVSWSSLEAFSADREENRPWEFGTGTEIARAGAAVEDYFPIAMAILNPRDAIAVTNAASGEKSANVLHAPQFTLFNARGAQHRDVVTRPFVIGFQAGVAGGPEPKIAVIDEGIKLTLRALPGHAPGRVKLEGRVELTAITDITMASATLRGASKTIQIPRVKRRNIDIVSELQDGQSLLIGCLPTYEQKQFFYVLLTVHHVWPPAEPE